MFEKKILNGNLGSLNGKRRRKKGDLEKMG
jgi:hypothetical protein